MITALLLILLLAYVLISIRRIFLVRKKRYGGHIEGAAQAIINIYDNDDGDEISDDYAAAIERLPPTTALLLELPGWVHELPTTPTTVTPLKGIERRAKLASRFADEARTHFAYPKQTEANRILVTRYIVDEMKERNVRKVDIVATLPLAVILTFRKTKMEIAADQLAASPEFIDREMNDNDGYQSVSLSRWLNGGDLIKSPAKYAGH